MARRLAASVLTLLLLINLALPASATETTDTVYPIGYKDMWVVGLETVPTDKTEYPGVWQPVYKADGVTRESQPGKCPLHACDTGCYDIMGNKTCGVAPGEEHTHNIKCTIEATIKYATYRWQVVDPTAKDDEEENEPQETQPVATEPDEDEYTDGSAWLKIYNTGVDGTALEGVEFILLEERTEPDPQDPEKTIVNQFVKGYDVTSSDPEKKGVAVIKSLRLTGDAERATWKLVQDRLPEELESSYRKVEQRWDVTIVRNADGTHIIEDVKPEGYDGESPYEDYNKETGTLTVKNEPLRGSIMIDVIFEGFENVLPEGVSATVTITTPSGEKKPFDFPRTETRYFHQQAQLLDLKMGTYSIEASAPSELDGYTVEGPMIQLQSPVDGAPNSNTSVQLSGAVGYYTAAKFTVTYRYAVTCEHVYTETAVPPTCTQNGYTIFTCECGDSYTEEGGQATGHEYESVVTDPTCTMPGYITYRCVNPGCGHSYVEDGEAATGHTFDSTIHLPTCTENGYTLYFCTNENCGESNRVDGEEATGHSYEAGTPVPVTCTEEGYTPYTCKNCGDTEKREVAAAIGHSYKAGEKVDATCTEDGYTPYTCENCGDTENREVAAAIGHSYEAGTPVPVTCTEEGYTPYTCKNCGDTEKREVAAATGHSYKAGEKVDATCTEDGYTPYTCENCGDTEKREVVTASGHSYKNGVCSNCGEKETKPTEPTEEPTQVPTETTPVPVAQSNVIVVRVVDDLGNPLKNTQIGLFSDKKSVRTWSATYDNVFVLDDLEKMLSSGESVSYTLKQTKASAGHHLAAESYTVTISKANGKTRVDVKKNAGTLNNMFKGSGVEMGTDGKQIVSFVNQRKTTQIELSCETAIEFAEGIWQDKDLIKECNEEPYQFLLKWENAKGEQQEETITVADENPVVLEAEIPYGTDYELSVLNEARNYKITLTDNCKGTIDAELVREPIKVYAKRDYSVEQGNTLNLHFVKVDADTKRPLQGVEFALKNAKGETVETYISGEDGTLIIGDVLNEPGKYTLHETKTVEGYQILSAPVQINVSVAYDWNNEFRIIQNLNAEIISNAVVEESDGSFWIENVLELEDEEDKEEQTEGSGIGPIIGIGVAGVAGLGGLAMILIRKKRRAK